MKRLEMVYIRGNDNAFYPPEYVKWGRKCMGNYEKRIARVNSVNTIT